MSIWVERALRFAWLELGYRRVYRKFQNATMVPRDMYTANLRLAALIRNVHGDIVECGTWRGGMIAGIAEVLGEERVYRLFDSYEGMPPVQEIDGPLALAWEKNTTSPQYYDHARASEQEARDSMQRSRAKQFTITKGWFRDTLPQATHRPIALLRMDADWYDSTRCILENLAGCVVPRGIVIVDDYGIFDGCTLAVNEWAVRHGWAIRNTGLGDVSYVRV
jgi:O-methyltransferase